MTTTLGYDEFVDTYGFHPLDEPDISYHDMGKDRDLYDSVQEACKDNRFVTVHDWSKGLDVSLGWGRVDALHRCFVPEGVQL